MKHYILLSLVFSAYSFNAMSQQADSVVALQNELIASADSLMANFQFKNALKVLAKGDSMDINIQLRIGQCHFRLGASTAAIHPYEKVLQLDSTNLTALNQLGQLHARNGEYSRAISCFFRLIALDSTNSYYYKQAGALAARSDEIVTAKFLFEKAFKLNAADVESALGLGNALMEMENYERVDSIVQLTLSVNPQFMPMLVLQARSAFQQHHYETVVVTVNKLLERSDTTAIYARLLGVSFFHLKDYDKTVVCMNYLLKNWSSKYDYEWVYFYMGVASRELGDVPASVKWLNMAAQKSISYNTKIYYSQLGQSYEDMGNYEEAIKAYRTAYNYSKDGILLYHLARNYDAYYEDKTTALLYYKKYLESDDTIRLAREYARQRMQDMGHF